MPNFSILMPPAEGKNSGGNPFAPDMFDYRTSNTFNYFNELNLERRKLIDALRKTLKMEDADLGKIFGVKGKTLEKAIEINRGIYDAPLMSALDRYGPGVMYKAMDFPGLPTGAQRRLLENGLIFSGLFGILRPDDLIPNYRLRMDAHLPPIGKVGTFWKERMSGRLNDTVRGHFVWNLLSGIHMDAWDDEHTYQQMVTVKFVKEEDGERKPVTHGVKTLRGELVNYICRETLEDLDSLMEYVSPGGFAYDPEMTTFDRETKTGVVTLVQYENGPPPRPSEIAAAEAEAKAAAAAKAEAAAAAAAENAGDDDADEQE